MIVTVILSPILILSVLLTLTPTPILTLPPAPSESRQSPGSVVHFSGWVGADAAGIHLDPGLLQQAHVSPFTFHDRAGGQKKGPRAGAIPMIRRRAYVLSTWILTGLGFASSRLGMWRISRPFL